MGCDSPRKTMTDDERIGLLYSTIDQLRSENVRMRRALDSIHDRLDYIGAYRPSDSMHMVWRLADEAIGSPGRRR